MNNKGFTLIEMLATIVILAIIGGIATVSVISIINTSKLKSEKVFVDKVSNLIDDYLDLYKPTTSTGNEYEFKKCGDSACTEENKKKDVKATQVVKSDGTSVYLIDLVNEGIIEREELINPKNKQQCLNGNGPEIKVYRDEEYVYYYYVDLRGTNTSCDISDENGIINTLPDDLSSEVGLS